MNERSPCCSIRCEAGSWGGADCIKETDSALVLLVGTLVLIKRNNPQAPVAETLAQIWQLACQYSLHRALGTIEEEVFRGRRIRRGGIHCHYCRREAETYVPAYVFGLNPSLLLSNLSGTGLYNAAVSLTNILNKYLNPHHWND